MSNPGTAAIWWRVSTDDQKEISPETQINAARALAIEEGLETPEKYIIGTDWHSLSVWDSPAMLQLRGLIAQGAISAVVMYDADRGPSKPAHRLMMRALCEENGVRILCRHGQVPDGEMGEVMEFLSAWSKEKQVHRAQQGARDGLRDRAKVKGLPVNGSAPYGYRLRYALVAGTKIPQAFEPVHQAHQVVGIIWKMALKRTPLRGICRSLVDQGIPAPKGGVAWNTPTVLRILKNPIYAGRYYALRMEAIDPTKRRSETYGRSSERRLEQEQWVHLDSFPVEDPLVTWTEWEAVQERLKLNKLHARRNAKKTYMLGGMMFCGHDGWRLQVDGRHDRPSHAYKCPRSQRQTVGVEKCVTNYLNGISTDDAVWENVSEFLNDPHTFMAQMDHLKNTAGCGEEAVVAKIVDLDSKVRGVDKMETELVGMKLRGQVSEEAFDRQGALLRAERIYYLDEIGRQRAEQKTLAQAAVALDTAAQIRDKIVDRLDNATVEDRRWVLEALATRVTAKDGGLEISIGVPSYFMPAGCAPNTEVA